MKQSRIAWMVAAALVVGVAVAAAGGLWRAETADRLAIAAQEQTVGRLQARITALEAGSNQQPDWAAVAAAVEPSVVTIVTDAGLGSGWVAHSEAGGSDIVTNFHVVADAWGAGAAGVTVRQGDRTMAGTILRVDQNDDLAVVHVAQQLAALRPADRRPPLGTTVMAVGSPLGLGGSVSIGVVSGFRSLQGGDYMQFSAPISPGNSGGPVVDQQGRVVGVASAKIVGDGVEALSLAIPVQTACAGLVTCVQGTAH